MSMMCCLALIAQYATPVDVNNVVDGGNRVAVATAVAGSHPRMTARSLSHLTQTNPNSMLISSSTAVRRPPILLEFRSY